MPQCCQLRFIKFPIEVGWGGLGWEFGHCQAGPRGERHGDPPLGGEAWDMAGLCWTASKLGRNDGFLRWTAACRDQGWCSVGGFDGEAKARNVAMKRNNYILLREGWILKRFELRRKSAPPHGVPVARQSEILLRRVPELEAENQTLRQELNGNLIEKHVYCWLLSRILSDYDWMLWFDVGVWSMGCFLDDVMHSWRAYKSWVCRLLLTRDIL